MHVTRSISFNLATQMAIFLMLIVMPGCGREEGSDDQGGDDQSNVSDGGNEKNSSLPLPKNPGTQSIPHVTCQRPDDAPSSLATINDLVSLMNSMPKPISLPCLLDVLPRPLMINATASKLSIQPAGGTTNPRIFIFYDELILTLVPAGSSARIIEMSELLSDVYSVKGEIEMPVTATLADDAPFTTIVRQGGVEGTTCAGCHGSETHPAGFVAGAYASTAFKPLASGNVSVSELVEMRDECGDLIEERCNVLRALFGEDDTSVQETQFPASMPTMF